MPSNSWVNTWAVNDLPTAAEYRKGIGSVFNTTLGSAAATIDITGIPTSYAHLRVVLDGRSDLASNVNTVSVRLNNDTAANYDYEFLTGTGAAASSSETFAATGVFFLTLPAATATAGTSGQGVLEIPNYAGTTFNKSLLITCGSKQSTATGDMNARRIQGFWRSTAAVNRVTLYFAAGGNFVTGTRATAYVMGA